MPIPDRFSDHQPGLTDPITGGFPVVPDDGVDLPKLTRALICGGGGDVAVTLADGSEIVLPSLAAGVIYPVRARRVAATGTTATGITGLT